MLLEIWGHYSSNSLSLLADSLHLFVDFLGFLVSLTALKWTQKKPTKKMSFGYSRVEILGALFSIFLIWLAMIYLFVESYHKFKNPTSINSRIFLSISIVGLFVNIFCLYFLHDHHEKDGEHRNLNIRAAYIHVIGDLIQSSGVILASIIMMINPDLIIVDIICTICFSILVLISTIYVVKDALNILLEKMPNDVNVDLIIDRLKEIDNFDDIIKLHVWNISANVKAIAVSIKIKEIWKYETGMLKAKRILYDELGFNYVIIEFDTEKTSKFVSIKEFEGQVEKSVLLNVEKLASKVLPLDAFHLN